MFPVSREFAPPETDLERLRPPPSSLGKPGGFLDVKSTRNSSRLERHFPVCEPNSDRSRAFCEPYGAPVSAGKIPFPRPRGGQPERRFGLTKVTAYKGLQRGGWFRRSVRLQLNRLLQSEHAPLLGPEHRQVDQAFDAKAARQATLHSRLFEGGGDEREG